MARRLDRALQSFRDTVKPLSSGLGGPGGRRGTRRALRLFTACDHYARTLAGACENHCAASDSTAATTALAVAADRVGANIAALATLVERRPVPPVHPAADLLEVAGVHADAGADRALSQAVHALRQLDRVIVDVAVELGVDTAADASRRP